MDDWMNNPKLKNLDPAKLAMLSYLATEGSKKSRSEMMPFLMSLMNNKGSNGIDFSGEEQNLMLDVLMQQLSPEERKKSRNHYKNDFCFLKKIILPSHLGKAI